MTKLGILLSISYLLPLRYSPSRRVRQWGALLVFLILAQLCWADVDPGFSDKVSEPADSLLLIPGRPYLHTATQLRYLEDPTRSLTLEQLCCPVAAQHFSALAGRQIDFGFTNSLIWLWLPVKNTGTTAGEWVLDFNSRFMNGLEAYLVRRVESDRYQPELLLRDSDTAPFGARQIPYRHLAARFVLAPDESAQLLIGYWSLGATVLPLTIETERTFYESWLEDSTLIVAFYACMLFMAVLSLAQFLILRSRAHLAYTFYIGSGMLYFFHMDGLSFQYLWPHSPRWNAVASFYLGLNISIFSALFARSFLRTPHRHPYIDKLLLGLIACTVLVMVVGAFGYHHQLKLPSFLVTTSGLFICLIAGVVSYRGGQKSARFYIAGIGAIFVAAVVTSLAHWFGNLFAVPATFSISKLVILFDALMFAMALADQGHQIKKQRDAAHRREKKLLQQDLAIHKKLNALEQSYERALAIAAEKSHLLASAGHDMRQPIAALRLALQRTQRQSQANEAGADQFHQAFRYLDDIISRLLDIPDELGLMPQAAATVAAAPAMQQQRVGAARDATEQFPVQLILDGVSSMFADDARAKGLQFVCMPSSAVVDANPVAVMRCVSNLVDNALKYTARGKVVLGCRRRPGCVEVQVLDTGSGIPSQEQQRLLQAYARGETAGQAPGYGLGLAIVSQLAREHAFSLKIASSCGRGSMFSIALQRAAKFRGDKVRDKVRGE